MFGRPKGGKPTRHLFVGNCGPGVGIDAEALENIFKQFGTARVIVPEHQENPRSAFVFATFDNEDEATAALLSLNGRPCASAGGRKFTVKYADLKKEPVGVTENPLHYLMRLMFLHVAECYSAARSCLHKRLPGGRADADSGLCF